MRCTVSFNLFYNQFNNLGNVCINMPMCTPVYYSASVQQQQIMFDCLLSRLFKHIMDNCNILCYPHKVCNKNKKVLFPVKLQPAEKFEIIIVDAKHAIVLSKIISPQTFCE